MKIWNAFGSEHSANLVMIGKFKEIDNVKEVEKIIESITEQVTKDEKSGAITIGENPDKYTDEMLNLLGKLNVNSLSRSEEHTSELQSLRHLVCRLLLE